MPNTLCISLCVVKKLCVKDPIMQFDPEKNRTLNYSGHAQQEWFLSAA